MTGPSPPQGIGVCVCVCVCSLSFFFPFLADAGGRSLLFSGENGRVGQAMVGREAEQSLAEFI
jgi:hypothetical protein